MRFPVALLVLCAPGLLLVALAGNVSGQGYGQPGYVQRSSSRAAHGHDQGAVHDCHDYFPTITFFEFVGAPSAPLPAVVSQAAYQAEQQKLQAAQQESSGVAAELKALRAQLAALQSGAAAGAADLPPSVPGAAAADRPPSVPGSAQAPAAAPGRAGIGQAAAILQQRCAECHTGAAARGPRHSGPVQLFDDAGAFALRGITKATVAEVIADGSMPPGNKPALSETEKATLRSWLTN